MGGLGRKEAREWKGGGNAMNVVSKLYYFLTYKEGDSTEGKWML